MIDVSFKTFLVCGLLQELGGSVEIPSLGLCGLQSSASLQLLVLFRSPSWLC